MDEPVREVRPMNVTTLFVDMNSFFASVEQQDRPDLRGWPVAVAAVAVDSTCCIAVSAEAKRAGVKRGMMVGDAKQRCAALRVVEARPMVYVQYHHRIKAAVETCVPVKEVHSIDEFSARLLGREQEPDVALAIARRVKHAIREQVGHCVTCSIGVAPNRFLAKVAADLHKPDGLTLLTQADLPHALYGLKLDDLPGIGRGMRTRLYGARVISVEQLCALPVREMIRIWGGVVGRYWWHWLRGDDILDQPTRRSSISHSHVLAPEFRTLTGAKAVLVRLIHKAAARLRKEGLWARRMEVYVSFTFREEGWRGEVSLGLCQDTQSMIEALNCLWQQPPPGGRPTQVAITLFHLTRDPYCTLPLFPAERRRVDLSRTVDQINERFGRDKLYFAGMHNAQNTAPTRIAFNHIPPLESTELAKAPDGRGAVLPR
jgi:DNA polymerase IV